MTSASELFYQRRSRVGRATTSDLELEPSSSVRNFHLSYTRRHSHSHTHSHSRHDSDGCDPLRRSPHVRHTCHRLSSHPDRASVRLDLGTSQLVPSNTIATEALTSTSRQRLTGNDRLPGAVQLARARLLERLRGVSVSGSRRSSRVFGISNREYALDDDLSVIDAGDWGTDIAPRWSARGNPFSDSTYQTERLQLVQESYKKKPPGLTPEHIDCLQLEIFSITEKGKIANASCDCSICLESFQDGDKLIHLACEHRFHSACLDPWLRTCGDCPYCRRDIVLSNHRS